MFSNPRDIAMMSCTCTWMRDSPVIDRVVKRKLDKHVRGCVDSETMTSLQPMANESGVMVLEFLHRATQAKKLGSRLGLGSFHSAIVGQRHTNDPSPSPNGETQRGVEGGIPSVFTFGRGFHGQLGHGSFDDLHEPVDLKPGREDDCDVDAAGGVDMLVNRRVPVGAVGHEADELASGTGIDAADPISVIACGGNHTCAVTGEGKLITWGLASSGELGHGGWTPIEISVPRLVASLRDVRVTSVSAGANHTMVVSECGGVWTCGRGRHGQLGHGHFHDSGPLQRVQALADRRLVAAAAGGTHSLVWSADGAVYSWGSNYNGQTGHGPDVAAMEPGLAWPRRIGSLRGEHVVSVAAGGHHTLVVTKSGTLYAFGRGRHGALGLGDCVDYYLPEIVDVVPMWQTCDDSVPELRIAAVAAGINHSVILTGMGRVLTCGASNYGQLGHGDLTPRTLFTEVEYSHDCVYGMGRNFRLVRVTAINSGDHHCAAVDDKGRVFTWGRGDWGQLGNGATRSQWSPLLMEKGMLSCLS